MKPTDTGDCARNRRALQDTLEVISGKWKLLILITLMEKPHRFRELAREVKISPRMLSRELQDMEMNSLISRTVYETKPVSVEYAITEYGLSLEKVLMSLAEWGLMHRRTISEGVPEGFKAAKCKENGVPETESVSL